MESTHFESLYPSNTRFFEIEQIFKLIKSGQSAQLVGLPGSGRSNLLKLLSYNRSVRIKHASENQKWYHFVYMDFSEIKKRNLFDVTKLILLSLTYSLSERNLTEEYEILDKYLKDGLSYNDELVLFQALKKSIDYLAIEKELTVVFLCDRFEQYIPDVTEQFFTNLRILRNRAKYRFSVILSLIRPLDEVIEKSVFSEFNDFIQDNLIYLKLYDKEDLDFRISYLEKVTGKKIDEKIKDEVIKLCGGHGKLSRLSFETLLTDEKFDKNELSKFLVDKSSIRLALQDILNCLNPEEKRNLLSSQPFSSKYLENVGLIKNNKIAIPLFEHFIKSLPHNVSEKISYDVSKNEIFKGNDPLSQKLSASEFRLLKFLALNPDRICEKDEIIKSVWKDSETQEGVTDQALEQIIYRLRKKIEDDPNNPKYIQTIKGRGLKFDSG